MNLFVSNETDITYGDKEVHVSMETKFSFENEIKLQISNVPKEGIKIAVRIPEYAKNYVVKVNDNTVDYQNEEGYAVVRAEHGTDIQVVFEAPAKFVRANPNVRADCGKAAVVKEPLVYCLEEIDNGKNLAELFVNMKELIVESYSDLFGGIVELTFEGERMEETAWQESELYAEHPVTLRDVTLKAVPYAYWNNHGVGEMAVWFKELIS